jgi:hypothetical protein
MNRKQELEKGILLMLKYTSILFAILIGISLLF